MWILSLLPFAFQALAMAFDEGYFHIRRGLPRWERIGHPLDTLTVLVCMAYVLIVPFSSQSLVFYCLLATFSSIFVTKDEFVHKKHCSAMENWLHAILFTLHPISLASAGFIWPVSQNVEVTSWITRWLSASESLALFLKLQFGAMSAFFVYQIVFWNILWKDKPVLEQ